MPREKPREFIWVFLLPRTAHYTNLLQNSALHNSANRPAVLAHSVLSLTNFSLLHLHCPCGWKRCWRLDKCDSWNRSDIYCRWSLCPMLLFNSRRLLSNSPFQPVSSDILSSGTQMSVTDSAGATQPVTLVAANIVQFTCASDAHAKVCAIAKWFLKWAQWALVFFVLEQGSFCYCANFSARESFSHICAGLPAISVAKNVFVFRTARADNFWATNVDHVLFSRIVNPNCCLSRSLIWPIVYKRIIVRHWGPM